MNFRERLEWALGCIKAPETLHSDRDVNPIAVLADAKWWP